MKKLTSPIKLSVSLAALLLSQASFAAGTDAGTIVQNTATISYFVSGQEQAAITSETAEFVVDRKVDLSVSVNGTANVPATPSSSSSLPANKLTYTLSNDGNSEQVFKITASHLGSDQFDAGTGTTQAPHVPQACQYTMDGGTTNHLFTASPAPTVTLAEDATATINVTCSMPNRPDVSDGDLSTIEVLATAVDGTGPTAATMAESTVADRVDQIDVVLADSAGTGDALRDAKHSARQTYEINVPMLTVVKTSTVVSDPSNGTNSPKRIPGAIVQYKITVENASTSTDATGVVITDDLTLAMSKGVVLDQSSISTSSGAATYDSGTKKITATGMTVPKAVGGTNGSVALTFNVVIQ